MDDSERHSLQNACDELIRRQNSLLIASRSADGAVAISYAPYLREEAGFYIFVSEQAKHTQNLLVQPQASILFIEPEAEAGNPFARRRLTFDCRVLEISKTHAEYAQKLDGMAVKFGEIIGILRTLTDFHLLLLQPQAGQFVAGFGKAFTVDNLGRLQ
ncbi:MAG: pyridoxamine 5'-phosphate oxidase family protein [Methylomonas sp.]|jgi:hypothetical protein|uniref:HugZ family pyridoxamine 5'-phosphate oxidase n=1 Tax=Methylomonas sp. TaxID=418 RepID=UPI0025F0D848|nr:pyridoxamine 5'-phosphate oxidase family protein [Methylomonas sp.]MCK9607094.1 pyridoxamine 5'-phosphate oxidase family protein [Methylomonas sp.]